jgi:hypothetical protein
LKSEAFDAYKAYEAELLRQKGIQIKKLFSDRGGEFVHDTPEHNGIAERLNRTLLEKVRAMLHASGLPKFLWGETVKHAVYVVFQNSVPRSGFILRRIPSWMEGQS